MFEVLETHQDRRKAVEVWERQGKSKDSFRWAYKCLKDNLLDGVFLNNFNHLDAGKKNRIECWKRLAQIKALTIADEKIAAMEVAAQTLRLAEHSGLLEIAISLAKELSYYFGIVNPNIGRYRRYRRKVRILRIELEKEEKIQYLFTEVHFLTTKGRDISELESDIINITDEESDWYRFNLIKFSLLTLYYQTRSKHIELINTCKEAIHYFQNSKFLLPYTTSWNFYRQMIPHLLAQGKYAEAETNLSKCLALPKPGTSNWHVTLLQKAMIGFYSNKPMIAYQAWKAAGKKMADHKIIKECWEVVQAYLSLYAKLGRLDLPIKFRLGRFLNSVHACSQDKDGANVAIITVALLHYLLDGKYEDYLTKASRLPPYWRKHLRGERQSRKKFFLKMMEKVYHCRFRRYRVEKMAAKDFAAFKAAPRNISIDAINAEVVPFEALWEIVLDRLK